MSLSSFNGTEEDGRETCLSRLQAPQEISNETALSTSCGVVWDGFNCWGPALPGYTVYVACPAAKGMDVGKQAYRHCHASGHWLNKDGFPDEKGWTNYTPCFTPEIFALIKRLYSGSEIEAMSKIDIARGTRILELFGLSLSFMALLLSLFVFYYFRSLRNPRTRLHRHLFVAMVIQVTVRLTLYIDQVIVRSNLDTKTLSEEQYARGIDNTPILCEAAYICLEYARTAMFMWMFVEGLYLHNMITVTVFEEKLSPTIYPLVGWVFPIPLTLSWAIVTGKHYGGATCWWGYNFTLYFWILEGPRLGVLVVNLAFLLNILRVLVTKLRQSNSSEAHQARKAVKAALVLLPLLGLTNLLNMLDGPLERSAIVFGLWSYTTHILTSCQGLILAFLYCFWNGEVQIAVKKFIRYKVLNGCKNQGGGNRKCSVQMTPMNNKSEKNLTIIPQPHGVEILTGQGTNPQSQLIRLNPVNSLDSKIIVTEEVPAVTSVNQLNENSKVVVEDIVQSEPNSLSCSNSIKISNNPSLIECAKIEGGKLRRVSKLRIWISPLILVNDNNQKQKSHSEGSVLSPKNKSLLDEESSGIQTPDLSSTEGCHFQIEYYDNINIP